MTKMINMLKNLHKEESGQDLIEYALIAALISVVAGWLVAGPRDRYWVRVHGRRRRDLAKPFVVLWKQAMEANGRASNCDTSAERAA